MCNSNEDVLIGETQTIYYIEAYKNRNSVRSFFIKSRPSEKTGKKEIIDDKWISIEDVVCDNDHVLKIYHSHYTKVTDSNQLYGPAEEPSIYCPECKATLGSHKDHIFKLDSNLEMQYVLRTVSTEEPSTHKLSNAVTKSTARNYNQICVPRSCGHCNADVYFNYTSRNVNKSKVYKGERSVQ